MRQTLVLLRKVAPGKIDIGYVCMNKIYNQLLQIFSWNMSIFSNIAHFSCTIFSLLIQ